MDLSKIHFSSLIQVYIDGHSIFTLENMILDKQPSRQTTGQLEIIILKIQFGLKY